MISNTLLAVALLVQLCVMLAVVIWAWQQRTRWQELLKNEFRQNRDDVGETLLRSQEQLHQQSLQMMRALNEVNLSLAESERKWIEVRSWGDNVQKLKDIFDAPAARGRILGEVTLERILTDILPPGYYAFQVPIGNNRVDAAITLEQAGIVIPIDSKFPEEVEQIVRYAREISVKYVRPDLGTSHFAYLYLPTEKLWFDVVNSPKIWRELVALKVLAVSPHTLSLALHSISCCVAYFESARSSQKLIGELAAQRQLVEKCLGRIHLSLQSLRKAEDSMEKCQVDLEGILQSYSKQLPQNG